MEMIFISVYAAPVEAEFDLNDGLNEAVIRQKFCARGILTGTERTK
jgi:hypothetical protein